MRKEACAGREGTALAKCEGGAWAPGGDVEGAGGDGRGAFKLVEPKPPQVGLGEPPRVCKHLMGGCQGL